VRVTFCSGGGAGLFIVCSVRPTAPRPPSPQRQGAAPLYLLFCTLYQHIPETPPIQSQIKTPHPLFFPATICLARTQKHPPSSFQIQAPHPLFFKKPCHLTRKTRAVVFVIAFCHAIPLEGVVLPSVCIAPSFPFTSPPSCCYTHAFTASLKPDAAPHARYKSRTYQGT
jgi:hypothetical protein